MKTFDLSKLTSCGIEEDGSAVRLRGENKSGEQFDIRVPLDNVGALTMTLPQLLTSAIRTRYQDPKLRYVFPLGDFAVESSDDSIMAILSLRTPDGFEVSFAVPSEKLTHLSRCCSVPDKSGIAPRPANAIH